jgi:hypothetical protein
MDALLGTTLDVVIAKQVGLSSTSVRKRRTILNIAPHGASATTVQWSQDLNALLETAPDSKLAAKMGCIKSGRPLASKQKGLPAYEQASR